MLEPLARQFYPIADDIVMLAPGKLARGKADVLATLRGNPANATSRARWNPVRGGISADGLHGFTFGHMVTTGTDGAAMPGKYLSYWIKGPAGWRVVAYKRSRAPEGMKISAETMPPALPERLVAPQTEPKLLSAYRESLASAERDFSDDAQKIGIGAAFARHGSADAINLGGPTVNGFLVGSDAIGRAIGEGEPIDSSALSWGPDSVVVASSGDLGLSVGTIRRNTPPADPSQPSTFPFFTIEDVEVLDARTLAVMNDNNFPAAGGRSVTTPDQNEYIEITLPEPLRVSRSLLPSG